MALSRFWSGAENVVAMAATAENLPVKQTHRLEPSKPFAWLRIALLLCGVALVPDLQGAARASLFRETTFQHSPEAKRVFEQLQSLETLLMHRAKRMTLRQVLERGLKANPQLAAAYARFQGEQWTVVAARRRWSPSLTAIAPIRGLIAQENGATTTTTPVAETVATATRSLATPLLNLNWTFLNLSRDAQIQAATSGMLAEQWLFDVSARNLVLELQRDYTNLQESIDLIDEYRALFLISSNAVDAAVAKMQRKQLQLAELEQLRTFQRNQLTRLINATRELLLASTRLAERLALPAEAMVLPEERLQPINAWPLDLKTTLEQAVRLREEIKALAADADRSGWQAQQLLRSYWPELSLRADAGASNLNSSRGAPAAAAPEITDRSSWFGSIGLGFNWQLFNGGIQTAEANNRRATQREQNDQEALEILRVEGETKEAYFNYLTSKLAVQNTKAAKGSAITSLVSTLQRFRNNQTGSTTLIQVLEQYINAIWANSTTIQLHNNAVYGLYRASAQWPEGTLPLIQERVQHLKQR